jgi:hypothetical protein
LCTVPKCYLPVSILLISTTSCTSTCGGKHARTNTHHITQARTHTQTALRLPETRRETLRRTYTHCRAHARTQDPLHDPSLTNVNGRHLVVVIVVLILWALRHERRSRLPSVGALLLEKLLDGEAGGVGGYELGLPLLIVCRKSNARHCDRHVNDDCSARTHARTHARTKPYL